MIELSKTSFACALSALLALVLPPAARADAPAVPAAPGAPSAAAAPAAPAWPDSFVSRLEALALVESLDAELLSHDSATSTLERWCALHRLASPARIVAERVPLDEPPSPQQRGELQIGVAEEVRYRRVRLLCGSVVLSEADNWYVPSRLTADMNHRLTATDEPFGKVVQALHFQRRTMSSTLLWRPLPDGWEMTQPVAGAGGAALVIPRSILEHRALLVLPDGTPISEVVETYTSGVLAFPPPRAGFHAIALPPAV